MVPFLNNKRRSSHPDVDKSTKITDTEENLRCIFFIQVFIIILFYLIWNLKLQWTDELYYLYQDHIVQHFCCTSKIFGQIVRQPPAAK